MHLGYTKKIIAFFITLSFAIGGIAQRGANWYFGNNAALKFTPTGPVFVTGSQMVTREGCSTLSDESGNLLFYTDGVTVWNKNNNIMANGTGLRGNFSSAQSSIVVPDPGNRNRYFIFTSAQQEATLSAKVYCYNIVDMSLQAGLGEVVVKNIVFDTLCSERLTAVLHSNGTDFWILTNPQRTNTFKAFLLSSTGFNTTPIVSNVGNVISPSLGMMKVSGDGKWLLQTSFLFSPNPSPCQLFKFNNTTGAVSNPISLAIPPNFSCSYGCAFSPNNKRFYIGCVDPKNDILQFSLTNDIDSNINKSRVIIPLNSSITASGVGDFSMGLDDKMYIARLDSRKLSAITNPNDTGTLINFVDSAFGVPLGSQVQLGLPNFYNAINVPLSDIKVDRISCLTYKFTFRVANTFPFKGIYRWDFGDGSSINNDSIPTYTLTRRGNDSFLVRLNFRSPDNLVSINQEVWVKLPPKPIAQFTIQTNGCVSDSVGFINSSTSANGNIKNYFWQLGNGTNSSSFQPKIKYNDTGTYTIKLAIADTLNCLSDTASQPLLLNKKVQANFVLTAPFCAGVALPLQDSSKAINATINNWFYSWNNGNSFSSTTIGSFSPSFVTEGLYTIKAIVNTVEGCKSDTTSKSYFIFNRPTANFILPKSCVLDVSRFTNTSTITGVSTINFYKWNFGVNETLADTSLLPNPSYQYSAAAQYPVQLLIVTNRGCRDSLTQNFTVNGAIPKAKFRFATNPICGGDSITLVNESSVDFGNLTKVEIVWDTFNFIDTNPTFNQNYKYKFPEFGTPTRLTKPIKLNVFSGLSCFNNIDSFITIKAQPNVNFVLPVDTICGNDLAFPLNQGIEINGALGSFTYTGNGVSNLGNNQFEFTPTTALPNNLAKIEYRFTTPENCFDTANQFVQVLPFPTANAGPNRIKVDGEQTTLLGTATGNNLQIAWQPAALTSNSTMLQPIVKINFDTTFLLTVTNPEGCFDTSSTKVIVLPPITPTNAFSPNNDGINDVWIIPNINLYPSSEVTVFNRNGQQLFRSVGYNSPWNGTYNQQTLPVATYYYVINLRNGKQPLSGWVQILR